MNPPSPPQRDVDVLWRVNAFAYHRIAPGQPYWWDNRRRPQEDCVVQVTLAGRIVFRDYHAGRDHEVGPRQLLLFNHGEASAYGLPAPTPQPYECLWFEFRGAGLRDHIRAFQATYGPVMGLDPEDRILGKMHR
ncbi:MAG: AraC family ligand binding domain-containing protein, partial [Phycisphaeraceae bacterium]